MLPFINQYFYYIFLAQNESDFWKSNNEDHHRMTVVKLPHGASKRKMSKPVRQRIRRSSTHSPSPPIDKIEPETKPALPPIVLTVPSMLSAMPVNSKHFFLVFFPSKTCTKFAPYVAGMS